MKNLEKWLHEPKSLASLDRALAWAEKHEPQDNFEEVIKKIESKKFATHCMAN